VPPAVGEAPACHAGKGRHVITLCGLTATDSDLFD